MRTHDQCNHSEPYSNRDSTFNRSSYLLAPTLLTPCIQHGERTGDEDTRSKQSLQNSGSSTDLSTILNFCNWRVLSLFFACPKKSNQPARRSGSRREEKAPRPVLGDVLSRLSSHTVQPAHMPSPPPRRPWTSTRPAAE